MGNSPPDDPDPRSRQQARAGCVLLGLALGACAPTSHREPPRQRSTLQTKATLFGDPALVPTRAGERARTELALAGTIREHLAEDPELAILRIHVALPPTRPPQVVISLRGPSERLPQLQNRAETVARAVVGVPETQVTVDLIAADPAQEPKNAHLRPFLMLALIALGASLGITIDRLRQDRGKRRPPA
ncbi:MAG TPA: hypothetical protein ENJ18_13225 [Nannocystis exedens]|nr:hypothetical protein [Nannocystis exedens]